MKKSEPPSQEEFDSMLDWLDPDREGAGEKLEQIRARLMKILERRQCWAAEELADETIDRVTHRVKDIAANYVGDPALCFYGFLRKVYQEWIKLPPPLPNPEPTYEPGPDVEPIYGCLEECLKKLARADRDLILKYFEKGGRAKIESRKELARELGITLNTLRMKVHRLNAELRKCINYCLSTTTEAESGDVLAG